MNHIPVLLNEVLNIVGACGTRPGACHAPLQNKTIVDCTFGAGGYSRAFLERGANVIAFDRDSSVASAADALAREFPGKFTFINKPFSELGKIFSTDTNDVGANNYSPLQSVFSIYAIVFDLGVSSMQIDTPERGFSFRFDAPLDMRMGQIPLLWRGVAEGDGVVYPTSETWVNHPRPATSRAAPPTEGNLTAAELIKNSSVAELTRILRDYGDVKKASAIARAMKEKLPQTTFGLRDLIFNPHDIAPVFQALRIAVNDELGEIETALAAVPALLAPGGICAAVTFHSLEDRLVKNIFREWTTTPGDPRLPAPNDCTGGKFSAPTKFRLLKTSTPGDAELSANPRAHSAHLRAVIKS